MVRIAALLLMPLLVTGCYTTVREPGAVGRVVDAMTGAPLPSARIIRTYIPDEEFRVRPLLTEDELKPASVLSDKHGHFDLPPLTHTQIAFMCVRNPKTIVGSFLISADGYATNKVQGAATSRTLWRVQLGRVPLRHQ
jgi:hypothetical protein